MSSRSSSPSSPSPSVAPSRDAFVPSAAELASDAGEAALAALGFRAAHSHALAELRRDHPALVAARVVAQDGERVRLAGAAAEWGEPSGRMRHRAGHLELPVIGDWVAVTCDGPDGGAVIHAVLPRTTALVRRAAGRRGEPQAVAANLDVGFIVTSGNRDANPRRVERYLAALGDAGARPVLIVNKVDLCSPEERARIGAELSACAPGVRIVWVSAATGQGLDELVAELRADDGAVPTVAFVGMSGVGKSSLVNALLGEAHQHTLPIDAEDRGRHTTTRRELFALPSGALVIDTPGMRVLGLVTDDGGLDAGFGEITALAATCRFGDCSHGREPGCAVVAALATGEVSAARLAAWRKLRREVDVARARTEQAPPVLGKRATKDRRLAQRARRKIDPKLRD